MKKQKLMPEFGKLIKGAPKPGVSKPAQSTGDTKLRLKRKFTAKR